MGSKGYIMTTFFIILIFSIIVIYDIAVLIAKKQTITAVFRRWYREKNIIPFMVGIVFIGHFQTLIEISSMLFFLIGSITYLLWYIIMATSDIKWSRKFYDISNKYFFIPMSIGTIIGTFWR